MRRKDREQPDEAFCASVLAKAETLFIALRNGDRPYCLPCNFAAQARVIYIHSALEGQKLDCIRADPAIGFSAVSEAVVDAARSTTWYRSVCGSGRASLVEEDAEKRLALRLIASKYAAGCGEADPGRVAIIRIDIEHLSGKAHMRQG